MALQSFNRTQRLRFVAPAVACVLIIAWPKMALAEVMDKAPSPLELWAVAGLCLTLAVLLSRWKPWLPFVVWPFSALFAFAIVRELLDPNVGHAMRAEAGFGYIVQAWIIVAMTLFGPLGVALRAMINFRKTHSHNV